MHIIVCLKSEIERLLTEIKSMVEIIKILQNERKEYESEIAPEPRPKTANTWTKVKKGYRKIISEDDVRGIPVILNRFVLPIERNSHMEGNKTGDFGTVKDIMNNKRKVIVIGDSHARGCASELNAKLNTQRKATLAYGIVKPRMGLEKTVDLTKKETNILEKKDTVVVWGGTNDIAKNNTDEGQKHLIDFVDKNRHTNIIVMSAPHRHDLINSSCVNAEVTRFNRKIKKQRFIAM
jgi:hypothetical protein